METAIPAVERLGLSAQELSGRVALVTGAGRGIGRETARALAYLGARVVIAELSESGAQVAAQVNQDGGCAAYVSTDVADVDSVAALLRRTVELYGAVDILINNAIAIGVAPVVEMDPEFWDRVLAVNLRGTFLVSQACLPGMLARGAGTIVNMVSTEAMPGLSAYIASKQGIVGFSQSLAAEVGDRGVRVIAFAPGMVDTPGIRGVAGGLAPLLGISSEQFLTLSLHPAYAGLMPPEDAAAAAAYLVARRADDYHGQVIDGYTLLEQAGYFPPSAALPVDGPVAPAGNRPADEPLSDLPALCRQFLEQLAATEAEFNHLPVFVRPMARSGLRGKSGHSLPDWQRLAQALIDRPADAAQTASPRWVADLEKLAGYYEGVPAETARFSRDAELLSEVRRISAERIHLIRRLHARLEALR